MRILHICGRMEIGGAERALYQLIASQQARGETTDLVAASAKSYYSKKVIDLGATVFEIRQRHSFDFTTVPRFLKFASNYDIIHFHVPNPALMLACLFLPREKKIFYTHRAGKHAYPMSRKLVYQIAGFCIRRKFTAISGNTAFAAGMAAETFGIDRSKIRTTYNAVNFNLLNPQKSRPDVLAELGEPGGNHLVRIGSTANMRKLKRIDYLVRCIYKLRHKKIHCYIIGDGPEKPRLEAMTAELGVSHLISFLGMKAEIGDYLQVMDIFVLPSDQSESFGNSAVEAMGMGMPTIVMQDGGGLVEHIPEGGGFIAQNIEHMEQLLGMLIDSAELRSKAGAIGKDYVRSKYTCENMTAAYDQLYKTERT